jgi:hypothetical protein
MSVERIVDSAEGREQRHVLSPPGAELHHRSVDRHDLAEQEVHEEDAGEVLGLQEQPEIRQELVVGERRSAQQREHLVATRAFGVAGVGGDPEPFFRGEGLGFHAFSVRFVQGRPSTTAGIGRVPRKAMTQAQ